MGSNEHNYVHEGTIIVASLLTDRWALSPSLPTADYTGKRDAEPGVGMGGRELESRWSILPDSGQPELAVPDIPAWTSASAGLRSPAPPASSLAVWSSEDARALLAAGMESRPAVLTSSRDPRPVGYPGKLWWDGGRLDVSRDRSQGMGPLPGNSGACVIFVIRELAGRKMLAFPGNTATQHICYRSTRG